ncbi:hypothetical protein DSY0706 [Desulfitobacterium hafniense Y51]|uniref:Uncharacterized protein n=1 Tax=Desulfitobacterium hafniense (strain Y51) TaxID=138119 RepID=Q24ZP7_DESHY|nr:hypothetical protein DSY0706 [Desulfitobacterium hafniense Y51]
MLLISKGFPGVCTLQEAFLCSVAVRRISLYNGIYVLCRKALFYRVNITIHIKNIDEDEELNEKATCKEFLQVQIKSKVRPGNESQRTGKN